MTNHLKPKEHDILCIMLNSQKPLTASEIVHAGTDLTMNTVQAVIRKLLKMELVEVADIVYSGNVLSRTFKPTANAPEIIQELFADDYRQFQKIASKESLIAAMLNSDSKADRQKEIEELESILNDLKNK